ncbi:hypothetical protein Tco_1454943, partial [Tanacetum coccineum]
MMSGKFTKHVGGLKQKDTSPPRHRSGRDDITSEKNNRKGVLRNLMKNLSRKKADTFPPRDPSRWRKDAAGNIVCKGRSNCQGCLCYEYDHTHPYSK